jgi:hypothetical protein
VIGLDGNACAYPLADTSAPIAKKMVGIRFLMCYVLVVEPSKQQKHYPIDVRLSIFSLARVALV